MNLKNGYQIQNETKLLLDDSLSKENNLFTLSAIQRQFNNTQQLLDDRTTSILFETQANKPSNIRKRTPSANKDPNSFSSEEKDSIMNNLNSSHSFNDDLLLISNTTKTLNDLKIFQINPEIDHSPNQSILSFGLVFPTSTHTLQYRLKNISNQPTTIAFKISEKDNLKEYFESYEEICNNSNNKFYCFRIMNKLQKVSLKHNEELIIQIELKAPSTKIKENLFSLLEIFNNNFIDKSIPLLAQIEIPKLCCLKSIQSATNGSQIPVISIRIELKSKGQRYRLPLKNLSFKDIEIEVMIDSKKKKKDSFWYNNEYYKCQFIFFPNHLVVPAQGTANLEMIAKVSKGITDENCRSNQINQKSIREIIAVKIIGTQVTYSFFLEAFLYEL